jgi:hypothetical protein
MQFMLMIYRDQERFAQVPDAEKRRVSEAPDVWYEKLQRSGHARAMNRLHGTARAATVRKSGDRFLVTDGPFAETKEVLAGFVILECRDLAEAVELAKTFPVAEGLAVEVRPVMSPEEGKQCCLNG